MSLQRVVEVEAVVVEVDACPSRPADNLPGNGYWDRRRLQQSCRVDLENVLVRHHCISYIHGRH